MKTGIGSAVALIAIFLGSIAAWLTHVVWIIERLSSDIGATAGQIALGVLGTLAPPIDVIHGLILWFS